MTPELGGPMWLGFANLAGAARRESPDPPAIVTAMRERAGKNGDLLAVGFSEVLVGGTGGTLAGGLGHAVGIPPHREGGEMASLAAALPQGFTPFYLPHLDSAVHRHPDAVARKWSSAGFAGAMRQGTGAFLRGEGRARGVLLRCPGDGSATVNDPLAYRGSRDTEPRTLLVLETPSLVAAFCQLESNTADERIGDVTRGPGPGSRARQVERIAAYFRGEHRPVALLGDFNARPGTAELARLAGFHHVGWPPGTRSYALPDDPYTHLRHRVAIDHAFVRGIPAGSCEIVFLDAPEGASDHRPILLRVG